MTISGSWSERAPRPRSHALHRLSAHAERALLAALVGRDSGTSVGHPTTAPLVADAMGSPAGEATPAGSALGEPPDTSRRRTGAVRERHGPRVEGAEGADAEVHGREDRRSASRQRGTRASRVSRVNKRTDRGPLGAGLLDPWTGRRDWASLHRRVYLHDVLACPCGGRRSILADIRIRWMGAVFDDAARVSRLGA